jgi:aminoglycoside 3-N-acetyltransferase
VNRTPIPVNDLQALGLTPGRPLLVHTSLRRLGLGRGGAPALFAALAQWAERGGGSVLTPSFCWHAEDPAGWISHPLSPQETAEKQRLARPFDPASSPCGDDLGFFPEYFRQQPGVTRGTHPTLSFAGIGRGSAEAVLSHPLHYPFGAGSPLGWVYRNHGQVLMAGTDLTSMTILHLAETEAPRSYVRAASKRVRVADGWAWYHGAPNCGLQFTRAAEVWGPALAGRGRLGMGEAIVVDAAPLVDIALARLADEPDWLLCDEGQCLYCDLGRRWLRGELDHIWYGDQASIPDGLNAV